MGQPAAEPANDPAAGPQQIVDRETPQPDAARAALVAKWCERINAAKKHFESDFQRMRKDQEYAREGADRSRWDPSEKYTANLVQRHVNTKVDALYAKNPRAVAKRRPRMEFSIWDGNPQTLQQAMMGVQAGLMDPNAMALLQDVQQGMAKKQMLDRVARTLELAFGYYVDEQQPPFKTSAKQLVRRTITNGVGYLKLGFQRIMQKRPEIESQIADVTNQLAHIQRLTADLADGELQPDSADAEEMKIALAALQAEPEMIVREGLTFGFPRSTEIIVDPRCRDLVGFVGARWIAHEMPMTADEIEETYGVDVGKSYTTYKPEGREVQAQYDKNEPLACVYEVQDKKTGTYFTVCEGYPDFLAEPAPPPLSIERFWNVFTLVFNGREDERKLYPYSDVYLIRPMQDDHNRAREGLREQRRANRPKYATGRGQLEDTDKAQLQADAGNVLIELNNLTPDSDVNKMIQRMQMHGIDPAMYDTSPHFQDIERVVGTQQANFGNVSGGTATESSIAENGRLSSVTSNVDDLDEFLTEVARAAGQIMLREVSAETAKKIAGPGAVWPDMSGQDIAEELMLEIKAGSSGRPNKAAELANLERAAPFLLQTPGVNPTYLASKMLERLDDDLDLEEAIVEGMPSIVAMNAAAGRQAQPATGDASTDPTQQGGAGGQNAPRADRNEPGPQPAFPAPAQMGVA